MEKVSLKYVPEGLMTNKSALVDACINGLSLVEVTAWHLFGTKPSPQQMMIQFIDTCVSMSHQASIS